MGLADLLAQLHLVVQLLLSQPAEVVVLLQGLVKHFPLVLSLLRQLLQDLGLLDLHGRQESRLEGKATADRPSREFIIFIRFLRSSK